jgi:hypothetical protein
MNDPKPEPLSGRRSFLKTVLPGGALMCLGTPCLLRALQTDEKSKQPAGQKHKFFTDSGMSFAEVFRGNYLLDLPIWRGLEKELGTEKLHEMLKRVIDVNVKEQMAGWAKSAGKNDLATYTGDFRKPDRFWQNVLTFDVVEDTPQAFEAKVTECLWATTFRSAKAADLGYILSCYGDYASAEGFNPKMRMIRSKTLMQGDAFCNHRYILEG